MNPENAWFKQALVCLDRLSEVAPEDDAGLRYSRQDLERGSAMMANLLQSLALPERSCVVVRVAKSVEARMLLEAIERTGHVFLPLDNESPSAALEQAVGHTQVAVVVCSAAHFGWISKIAFKSGTQHVFTLNDDRTGSLLDRAVHHSDQQPLVWPKS